MLCHVVDYVSETMELKIKVVNDIIEFMVNKFVQRSKHGFLHGSCPKLK